MRLCIDATETAVSTSSRSISPFPASPMTAAIASAKVSGFRRQVSGYTSTNCRALQHSAAGMAGPPAWLLGVVASVAALSVLGDDFGLFTSLTGAMYAALGAFWFGAGLAALLDARHGGRNAVIVALSVAALVIVYIGVAFTRVPPPGSTGGPNVLPP